MFYYLIITLEAGLSFVRREGVTKISQEGVGHAAVSLFGANYSYFASNVHGEITRARVEVTFASKGDRSESERTLFKIMSSFSDSLIPPSVFLKNMMQNDI